MADFETKAAKYKAMPMDAMTQFHVVRRLGPVLPSIGNLFPIYGLMQDLAEAAKDGAVSGVMGAVTEDEVLSITKAATPIAEMLAKMSDADSEYVINACLSTVEVEQIPGRWAPLWNATARRAQIGTLDFMEMMQIVYYVLRDNFAGFFPASPSTLSGSTPA